MQSLQDKKKKKNYLKDACACDEEVRKVRDEINETEARFLELVEKSSNCRIAADCLEEGMKGLQAGEERRGSRASQSNGCMQDSRSKHRKRNSTDGSRFQPHLCTWQRGEELDEGKEQPVVKWVHQRQVGAMKAFWLVLLMILLGTRMQTVRAVEEDT